MIDFAILKAQNRTIRNYHCSSAVWIISNESNKYYYRSKLFKDRNKKEKAIFDRHGLSGFSSAEGCFRQPKQVTFTDRAVCVSV